MKAIIWSLLIGGAFSWGLQNVAQAGETRCVTVTATSEGGGENVVVVDSVNGPSVKGTFEVIVATDQDGEPTMVRRFEGKPGMAWVADGNRQAISLTALAEDDSANSGWLGVQLGTVDTKDASGTETNGVSILNVAKGSAAEAAGFELHDTIIEVDDIAVDELADFVGQVRDSVPGERIKFTVLRDGERRTLAATLGSRADAGEIEWLHDTGFEFRMLDGVQAQAKMLQPGENGEWAFSTIDIDSLPKHIGRLMPDLHTRCSTFAFADGDETFSIKVVKDGESISVASTDDGQIKVSRIDEETGEETVSTYANKDELAEADEDAFEFFSGTGSNVFAMSPGGHTGPFSVAMKIDGGGNESVWLEKIEEEFEGQSGAMAKAIEQLKNIRVEINADGADGNTLLEFIGSKAKRSILMNPDGTIDVTVRKGENELVTRYADEADLEARNAEAYEVYLDLQTSDE